MLQAFAAGRAAGATPAAPTIDAFGNVLCATGIDHEGPSPTGDHGKMANCCTFGCSNPLPILAVPPVQQGWLIELRAFAIASVGLVEIVRAEHSDFDPASPRAPPVIR